MKCDYCAAPDHLVTVCPTKAADRRKELIVGILFFVIMVPAWLLGAFFGLGWSSLRAGFMWMDDIWPQTWKAIAGKKKDEGE